MSRQSNRKFANEMKPVSISGIGLIMLMLLHSLLSLAMRASSLIATAHALFTLALGILFALSNKNAGRVKYVAAYIVGAEVLWRMTNAQIFWEGGKYFIILILGIGLLRSRSWQRAGRPILYFLLLSLSIPLTIMVLGTSSMARDAISFNLSGSFALMVCALYFSQITLDQDDMRQIAWWMLLPIFGIGTLALSGTLSAQMIAFTSESNFATSGGFGPNQVSAILGLGGALAFLLFLTGKDVASRWFAILLTLGLLALSALTFSRGGFYNAVVMAGLALAHSLRDTRGRIAALLTLLVVGLVGGYLIYPRINSFTGGALERRFSDMDTTNRTLIAQADLELWYTNPALGVGPGMSSIKRPLFSGIASHTEYTRVLAEHGTAGLLSLLILLALATRAYLKAPDPQTQIWVSALIAWPLVEMSHAAMRVVAISFLFGLVMVNWDTGKKKAD